MKAGDRGVLLCSGSLFRYAHRFQYHGQGTEFCETGLKQIEPHKTGKEEPVFVDEKWVTSAVHTQCQAEKNKETGGAVNPV